MSPLRWQDATPERIAALRAECSGKRGGPEAEGAVQWDRETLDAGFVDVYSTRGAEIAAVIDRCGSAIVLIWQWEEVVHLRIRTRTEDGRKVYRGLQYAFAPIDGERQPFPASAAEEEEP